MSDVGVDLRTILLADPDVAALIGTRVYPGVLPQNPTMPAVTYTVVSGVSGVTTDGPDRLANPRVQVDCWGGDYIEMYNTFKAVRNRLLGYSGLNIQGIFLVGRRDLYDNEAQLYRRSGDFQVWHEESD